MAPEQLEGTDADPRTDIYAFGVVLYEMLTGKLPFDGKTRASLIAAILTESPRAITQLQPLVPPSLNHVVATCLVRDPELRWQSVRDIAHSLKWITETSSTVTDVRPVRRGQPRPQLAWLAAGLGLLAALAMWASTSFAPAPQQAVAAVQATIPLGPGQRLAMNETPTFAVSPDGAMLAYVVATSGSTELYVRRLDSTTATLVADSTGASYPRFSPDSKRIAFLAAEGLRWVPLAGGAPVAVAPPGTFAAVRGLMWGSDGAFIISTFQSGLMHVPETGGLPMALTKPNFEERE
jgi:serine/threonine-protein kinase